MARPLKVGRDRSGADSVSRETLTALRELSSSVIRWNRTHNLIATSTVDEIWDRHVLDCLQLWTLKPAAERWVDLGSGAGFPGLVIAIALTFERTDGHVTLVESNRKKAAFLTAMVGQLNLRATVRSERIDKVQPKAMDVITARALAPLPELIALSSPWLQRGAVGLFQKGRGYREEIEETSLRWSMELIEHTSALEPDGVILEIADVRPR